MSASHYLLTDKMLSATAVTIQDEQSKSNHGITPIFKSQSYGSVTLFARYW
jgi:hypothetical protein